MLLTGRHGCRRRGSVGAGDRHLSMQVTDVSVRLTSILMQVLGRYQDRCQLQMNQCN